jgi:hypothetical protein
MRSKVTVVSYLHCGVIGTNIGVINTAVPFAAQSDFPIKTVLRIIRKSKVFDKVGYEAT